MQIHIKRKHNDRFIELTSKIQHRSAPNDKQPSLPPNHKGLHINDTFTHPNPIEDVTKQTETILDTFTEKIRRINELNHSINEFNRNFAVDSGNNQIANSLLIQTFNLFSHKQSVPAKKETLPTGYRISYCDTCLPGCSLKPVFYPIEFEAQIKTDHKCDFKNLLGQNEEQIMENRSQVKVLLEDNLSKVVSSSIGGKDAYLRAVKLSKHAFSEEKRRNFKIPRNSSLIEERDCIRVNFSHDMESKEHWFCRTISAYDKNSSVKIMQNELTEFLKIAKSTFGLFEFSRGDPAMKYYFLIYLVL
jgi:hypothetical protein